MTRREPETHYTAVVPWVEIASLLALGLFAGALGGLVGVGGSIIIIPVLTLVLRHDQHLSQAVAMIINVFVAGAAVLQHHRADAIRWIVTLRMLPAALVLILAGVLASNALDGQLLTRIFGVFLLYVIAFNVVKLIEDGKPYNNSPKTGWWRCGFVGGAMGLAAGLLGIGGAPVAIPLLQRLCHLPLRQAIAASSAVMCVTAAVGAALKNQTLNDLTDASGASLDLSDSLVLAIHLAPTATLGALIGAGLTHALPVRWVRLAFILLMIWASFNMLRGG